jgi:AraC-like DNA-binding protein
MVLLRAAGLGPAAVFDPDGAVPHRQNARLWDEAVRLTGDQDLGLHMAEWVSQCPEEHFDVLAYAVQSCASLGEHYRRMGRYVRLLHEGAYLSLEIEQDTAKLVHGLLDGAMPPRQPVECMLALAVLQGRRAIGEEFAPRAVCFAHPWPARVGEQERLFRAPVRYGCEHNEVVLDRALLERRQLQAEPRLLAMLDRQLEGLLSRLPEDRSLQGQARRVMADHLLDGEPALYAVAAKLHMSPRSLQRRLRDEGTSFAKLLADLRRDLALRHLQSPRTTIGDVAFLLGFSEVSAFHRAFKRWTGRTPAEHLRSVRKPSAPERVAVGPSPENPGLLQRQGDGRQQE